MKNSKKNKKSSPIELSYSLTWIPAQARFCDPTVDGKPYVWQSWGLVIRHLRVFTGMDQSIFGRMLQGYTRTQISRYETEDAEPPVDFWIKMAKTFGLDITWALSGSGKPYTNEFRDSEHRLRFFQWQTLLDKKDEFLRDLRGSSNH